MFGTRELEKDLEFMKADVIEFLERKIGFCILRNRTAPLATGQRGRCGGE
jgi:hypothetical protein